MTSSRVLDLSGIETETRDCSMVEPLPCAFGPHCHPSRENMSHVGDIEFLDTIGCMHVFEAHLMDFYRMLCATYRLLDKEAIGQLHFNQF